MKRILCLIALASAISQAATVRVVDNSTRSKNVQISKDGQPVQVELREIQVQISSAEPAGQPVVTTDILMLHEPQTGLFLWGCQDGDPDHPGGMIEQFQAESIAYLTGNKLVEFLVISPSLWIRESTEHHTTMNEGQTSVISTLQFAGNEAVKMALLLLYQEINLGEILGIEFLYNGVTDDLNQSVSLGEVSRAGSQWHVVVEGPNGNSATVLLDDRYGIVSPRAAN